MYLLIYIIGFIVAYIGYRLLDGSSNNWEEVFKRIFYSLFSWLIIILFGVFCLVCYVHDKYKLPKPPKWL